MWSKGAHRVTLLILLSVSLVVAASSESELVSAILSSAASPSDLTPRACRGTSDDAWCCFESLSSAIMANFLTCPSNDIYLDYAVYQENTIMSLPYDFHIMGRDPQNRPILLDQQFVVPESVAVIQNASFSDLVVQGPLFYRVKNAEVHWLSFTNVHFEQTDSDVLTFSIKDVVLTDALTFINCTFTSTEQVSYGASFAMIETRQQWNPDTLRFGGELVFDGLSFSQTFKANQWDVLTLDLLRTANVVIKNSAVSSTSVFAFYRAYNVTIQDSTFEDSGATFVTSSMITLSRTESTGRPIADYLYANTEAFFVFYESYPGLPHATVSLSSAKFENITKDPAQADFPLEGGIISVPTTQTAVFSNFDVRHCSFSNISAGIYAIKNADDRQAIFARSNWWGSSGGPKDECNGNDGGSELYWNRNTRESHVKYTPWCSSPTCRVTTSGGVRLCPTKGQLLAAIISLSVGGALVLAILGLAIYCLRQVRDAASFQRVTCIPRAAVENMSPQDIGAFYIPYAAFNGQGLTSVGRGGRGNVVEATLDAQYLVGHPHLRAENLNVVIKFPLLKRMGKDSNSNPAEVDLTDDKKKKNRKSVRWELYLLHCFNHNTFPTLVGYTETNDKELGIVMLRMLPLPTLKQEMQTEWSLRQKHKIVKQVASGLSFLHSHRIIHGDLKPGNLLFSDSAKKHVVISDLGDSYFLRNGLTKLHTAYFGTTEYACPSFKGNGDLTMEADIYSFGRTVCQIYSGELPSTIQSDAADGTLDVLAAVPEEIKPIIADCLSLTGASRPSIGRVLKELAKLKKQEPGPGVSSIQYTSSNDTVELPPRVFKPAQPANRPPKEGTTSQNNDGWGYYSPEGEGDGGGAPGRGDGDMDV